MKLLCLFNPIIYCLFLSLFVGCFHSSEYIKQKNSGKIKELNSAIEEKAAKKRHEKIIAASKKEMENKPCYFWEYKNRGSRYRAIGQFDKAVAHYSKAIEMKPDDYRTYILRGHIYSFTRQYDKAIIDYNKVIDLKPDKYQAYDSKGNAYGSKGDNNKAIADFFQAYNGRGTVYGGKGQYDKAIADFDKAIKFKFHYHQAYFNRGFAYSSKGQYDKAIADYNKVIDFKPYYSDAVYLFRYIASKHANINEGKKLQKYAKNIKDKSWIYPVMDLYLGNITPDECLSKAKHNDPKTNNKQKCEAYYYIGEYYLLKNEKEKAKQNFEKCVKTNAVAFFEYSLANAELNKLKNQTL